MKIGLSTKAYPVNMTIPQGLRLAKRSGFDCVELYITEAGYLTLESDAKAVQFLRSAVENMSLEVGSVRADVMNGLEADCDYPRVLRRCLEISSELGCSVLEVPVCGGQIDVLGKMAREIESFDTRLGFDCTSLGMSSEAVVGALEELGVACAGVCVDTGNSAADGSPENWIGAVGDRLVAVRARDYRRCGELVHFTNLLEGDVDWKSIRKTLIEIGYNGVAIAEVPGYKYYPELGIKHCGEQMKRIFGAPVKGRD